MLKISTQHSIIAGKYGLEDTLNILSEAGFEAVDLSITGSVIPWDEGFFTDPFCPEFAEYFRNISKCAKERNLEICMTHAPYCRTWVSEPEAYAEVQQQTIRGIYANKYLGSPYTVAHPVLHPDFDNGENKERCLQTNLDYFSAFVPALKETGVIMCIENLFRGVWGKPKIPNACSNPVDLAELIDRLNEMHGPLFAACLDTGHAKICGQDPTQALKVLAHRVKVLHVNDNDGVYDIHTAPGLGVIDWESWTKALKEIGYNGCLNFETDSNWDLARKNYCNRQVMVSSAKLLYDLGRSLLAIE